MGNGEEIYIRLKDQFSEKIELLKWSLLHNMRGIFVRNTFLHNNFKMPRKHQKIGPLKENRE